MDVLRALEKALGTYEYVPMTYIVKHSGLSEKEVDFQLDRLEKMQLISRTSRGSHLIFAGLDALALNALVKRDLISGMGGSIGVGKESDVFEVVSDLGELYAVKFYRIGRISFRATRRKRSYSPPTEHHHWLAVSINAAKREFDTIRKLLPLGVSVPEVLARERHVLLMKKIDGVLLSRVAETRSPKVLLRKILLNIRNAYLKCGIVNSDLSEYNVLCSNDDVWLIDWPQAVDAKHSNASIMLDRDILNILRFFERKFGVECKLESASFYVRGWRDRVEIQ